MAPLRILLSKLFGLFRKARLEQQLDEDVRAHLEMLTEENLRKGMNPEEARYAALRQFGNVGSMKEECRETWSIRIIEELSQDIRYGLRQLRRNPGFTAVAIITLALGIGATTALFSVVYGVVLNPLPYSDSNRLVVLIAHNIKSTSPWVRYARVSPAELLDYREQNHVFDQLFGGRHETVRLTGTGLPEWMNAARLTGNFFQSVGGKPLVGRTFTPADCKPGAPPVIVLSYKTWVGKFNRDPKVVGRTLILDHRPTTVIGVTPPRFTFLGGEAFLPEILSHAESSQNAHPLFLYGHLKQGVTLQQANVDVGLLARRFRQIYPKDHPKDVTFYILPLVQAVVQRPRRIMFFVLFAGVGLLLLIACVNVANLLLARGSMRRHEIAVRATLGASRGRLVRQLMIESLMLAASGSVLGCLVAWSGLADLASLIPPWDMPSEAVIRVNFPVLLFAVGLAVVSTLLFGLAPAALTTRKKLQSDLNLSGRTGGGSHGGHHWIRNPLVASEVALSLVLLTGAGLLFRSFWTFQHIQWGINANNLLGVFIVLPEERYKTPEQRNQFYLDALRRMPTLPGAVSASLGWPTWDDNGSAQLEVGGQSGAESRTVWFQLAGDQFFKTLGIPAFAGRTISRDDLLQGRHVVDVNRAFVNKYFAGGNALGRQIKLKLPAWTVPPKDTGFEIVGVVADTTVLEMSGPVSKPKVFLPFTVTGSRWGMIYIRTARPPAGLTNVVRKQFASMDEEVPISTATVKEGLSAHGIEPRFITSMLVGFALLGMVLVCIGIYGVLSYSVSQRTHEIGVRMALGAQAGDVRRMVLIWGLRWLAIGIGIGVPASIALAKVLQNRFWGITSADPLTMVVVSLVLIAVGLVACYIPARWASKADPMVALRYE